MTTTAGTLDTIESKLATRPEVAFRRTEHAIIVDAHDGDGFEVGVSIVDDEWLVWFEGWHELFATVDEAMNAFAWGLSDACRLEITYRGNTPVAWTIQSRTDGEWCDDGTVGMLVSPFWRKKRVVYKQNRVLSDGRA